MLMLYAAIEPQAGRVPLAQRLRIRGVSMLCAARPSMFYMGILPPALLQIPADMLK